MIEVEELFGKTIPAEIKNPFNAKYIENIHMSCYRGVIDRKLRFCGDVEFKNADTEGRQKFEASNFSELFMKIMRFCRSLEQ